MTAGDTSNVVMGLTGFSGRQLVAAGSSILMVVREVAAEISRFASHTLEASEYDRVLASDRVHGRAGDKHQPVGDRVRPSRHTRATAIPEGIEPGLEATVTFRSDALAYATACRAVEIEVDPDSASVRSLR